MCVGSRGRGWIQGVREVESDYANHSQVVISKCCANTVKLIEQWHINITAFQQTVQSLQKGNLKPTSAVIKLSLFEGILGSSQLPAIERKR